MTLAALAATAADDARIDALLARMTLEEKVGQLIQYTPSQPDLETLIAGGRVGSVFGFGGAAATNAMQRIALENSRLGIPLLFGHDVIHGYRTIFPNPLAIAATWDPASAEIAARTAATEARAAGLRWTFAPMVDIARDPRWGRIVEGAGEDPFLGAAMARAAVRGFQGPDPARPDALLACAKHFAAYGAAGGGRDYNTTDLSERTLREIYLPPFRAAVDAGAASLMSAFNALNGVPATANAHLLDEILRREWGFDGMVVSDYDAVVQLIPHGVAGTPAEAAIQAITAGVDMNMVDGAFNTLVGAVRAGRIEERVVHRAARRVLEAKANAGLFDQPLAAEDREARVTLTRAHRDAARAVAEKSVVLLKNEGVLPLSKTIGTLALIGPWVDEGDEMLGAWRAMGKGEDAITILEGVRREVSPTTRILHAKGVEILEGTDEGISEAVALAKRADAVVAFLGEGASMSGEAQSRVSLGLMGQQQELLEALVATGKPVVLVVMAGRPLTIEWAEAHVPSILYGWFLGVEAGNALANILFGDVSPSGKLPVTIPRSVGQIPLYYNHLPTGRPAKPDDRYTSKYTDSPNEPLWPFGFGLSYTTFAYGDLRVSAPSMTPGGTITVSAEVTNSGARAGDEIVQLYINDPVASVSRPVRELKGFQRVALRPGESRRVSFTIGDDALRFWGAGGWTVEPGTFAVWIGPSSRADLNGSFEVRRLSPSPAEDGDLGPADTRDQRAARTLRRPQTEGREGFRARATLTFRGDERKRSQRRRNDLTECVPANPGVRGYDRAVRRDGACGSGSDGRGGA
jgi:beta-glucosidase